jgi:hypothetical protein
VPKATRPARPPQTPKPQPSRPPKVPALKVDPAKYPNLAANPSLERALRIRQALGQGLPREQAVALADQAMGPRGRPKVRGSGRPASGPRPGGEAERPRRKPPLPAPPPRRRR